MVDRKLIMRQICDPENQKLICDALSRHNTTTQLKISPDGELLILSLKGHILKKREK